MDNPEPSCHDDRTTEPATRHRPSGFWKNLALTLVIAIAGFFAQIVTAIGFVIWRYAQGAEVDPAELETNGDLISLATLASMPVVIALCSLFVWLRGNSISDYLGLKAIPAGTAFRWIIAGVVLIGLGDLVTWLLNRPIVPEFVIQIYTSTRLVFVLWVAMVVAAPLAEEFLFRGFFFRGIQCSRLGATGAIVISSAVWASIHLQYDLMQIAIIFVAGLFLGLARCRTESLYPCIAIHALMNLVATVQVAVMVK